MASINTLTPTDVYAILNEAASQMFGKDTMTVIDTSTFVTVGENMLHAGKENTLNALFIPAIRKLVDIRPYKGKFNLISMTKDEFAGISSRISFLSRKEILEESEDWNTNLNATQLNDGNAIDQYEIKKVYPYELTFTGLKVYQKHYTTFEKQLKIAFSSEAEFAKFYSGMLTLINNEIEVIKEAEARLTLLNYIGALYLSSESTMKVNLTAAYNAQFSTSYTTDQLLGTQIKNFLPWFVSFVGSYASMFDEANELLHQIPTKQTDNGDALTLIRHCPKDKIKFFLYEPFIRDAKAYVYSGIFNEEYLKIENYEPVEYWQHRGDNSTKAGQNTSLSVKVKPSIFDVTTGEAHAGSNVQTKVLGLMFDERACGITFELDSVKTTPYNAAGEYYNTFYHFARKYKNDLTQKGVLFYMEDPASH